MRRVVSCGIALVFAAGMSAACSTSPGEAVPADWTSSPVFSGLESIPADSSSKFEISLVNTRALNRIDRFSEDPKSTESPGEGLRPPAEFAWINYAIVGSVCDAAVNRGSSAASPGYYTGPSGDMLSVYLKDVELTGAIAVCQNSVDLSKLQQAKPRTVGDTSGFTVGDAVWMGQRNDLTYVFGADVSEALQKATLAQDTGDGVLARDPQVRAVLDANPRAAAVEMGTIFTRFGGFGKKPLAEEVAAAEQRTGADLPPAEFGGYGWTPAADALPGTGVFVTCYASEAEASSTAKILTSVWPEAGDDSPFRRATTTVSGTAVITTVPDIHPRDFNLRTLRLAEYPAYIGAE